MKHPRPRILMVAPTCGVYGGIETFTVAIAREVIADGECDVRVIFRLRPGFTLSENLSDGLKDCGVDWRIMGRPDSAYFKDLLWSDVVNCHFPLLYATFPAKLLGKKLAVTVENRRFDCHGWAAVAGLKLADLRWYIASFVANTWEGAQRWKHSSIVPAVSELPDLSVPIPDRKGFFFIARWVPLKGLEQLVEAYATAQIDHAAHPLTLLGDGELRGVVEGMISSHGVAEFIDAPGFVSHAEKCLRMAAARWNVAPAAFPEDLGLSPIEARSCGVPSIISNIGGLPEAAGDEALRCVAGDVASLREAIEEAVRMDDQEYQERCRRCRESLSDYLPKAGFYTKAFKDLVAR